MDGAERNPFTGGLAADSNAAQVDSLFDGGLSVEDGYAGTGAGVADAGNVGIDRVVTRCTG